MNYTELHIEERDTLQISLSHSLSLRAIARLTRRSPSTINREIKRNSNSAGQHIAPQAQQSRCKNRLLRCLYKLGSHFTNNIKKCLSHLLRRRGS